VDRLGRAVGTRVRTHSLMGTLTYNFGEPPAPPPPPVVAPPPRVVPPPPPPPPPLPPPVCNSGPYIVFFDWDKDAITADAAQTLDNAVSAYANCRNTTVMIAGHADRSGRPAYNVGLSQRRANNVQGYMAARGIPGGAMTTNALGESQNRVPTPDGVRNDQNRRVEINYGPGSGR
ncbi:MAG: OmpA family protein, partial [Sphingopyxis sp.]